jgi:hypothetical protein
LRQERSRFTDFFETPAAVAGGKLPLDAHNANNTAEETAGAPSTQQEVAAAGKSSRSGGNVPPSFAEMAGVPSGEILDLT